MESVNKVFSVVYNESTDELLTGGQGQFLIFLLHLGVLYPNGLNSNILQ